MSNDFTLPLSDVDPVPTDDFIVPIPGIDFDLSRSSSGPTVRPTSNPTAAPYASPTSQPTRDTETTVPPETTEAPITTEDSATTFSSTTATASSATASSVTTTSTSFASTTPQETVTTPAPLTADESIEVFYSCPPPTPEFITAVDEDGEPIRVPISPPVSTVTVDYDFELWPSAQDAGDTENGFFSTLDPSNSQYYLEQISSILPSIEHQLASTVANSLEEQTHNAGNEDFCDGVHVDEWRRHTKEVEMLSGYTPESASDLLDRRRKTSSSSDHMTQLPGSQTPNTDRLGASDYTHPRGDSNHHRGPTPQDSKSRFLRFTRSDGSPLKRSSDLTRIINLSSSSSTQYSLYVDEICVPPSDECVVANGKMLVTYVGTNEAGVISSVSRLVKEEMEKTTSTSMYSENGLRSVNIDTSIADGFQMKYLGPSSDGIARTANTPPAAISAEDLGELAEAVPQSSAPLSPLGIGFLAALLGTFAMACYGFLIYEDNAKPIVEKVKNSEFAKGRGNRSPEPKSKSKPLGDKQDRDVSCASISNSKSVDLEDNDCCYDLESVTNVQTLCEIEANNKEESVEVKSVQSYQSQRSRNSLASRNKPAATSLRSRSSNSTAITQLNKQASTRSTASACAELNTALGQQSMANSTRDEASVVSSPSPAAEAAPVAATSAAMVSTASAVTQGPLAMLRQDSIGTLNSSSSKSSSNSSRASSKQSSVGSLTGSKMKKRRTKGKNLVRSSSTISSITNTTLEEWELPTSSAPEPRVITPTHESTIDDMSVQDSVGETDGRSNGLPEILDLTEQPSSDNKEIAHLVVPSPTNSHNSSDRSPSSASGSRWLQTVPETDLPPPMRDTPRKSNYPILRDGPHAAPYALTNIPSASSMTRELERLRSQDSTETPLEKESLSGSKQSPDTSNPISTETGKLEKSGHQPKQILPNSSDSTEGEQDLVIRAAVTNDSEEWEV